MIRAVAEAVSAGVRRDALLFFGLLVVLGVGCAHLASPDVTPLRCLCVRRDHWHSGYRDAFHQRPNREVEPRLGVVQVAIGDDVTSAGASDS